MSRYHASGYCSLLYNNVLLLSIYQSNKYPIEFTMIKHSKVKKYRRGKMRKSLVVIIGASSGIGAVIAKRFSEAGHSLLLIG